MKHTNTKKNSLTFPWLLCFFNFFPWLFQVFPDFIKKLPFFQVFQVFQVLWQPWVSQFKAVAHTLVRTGIRFSHPNTIIHLYNSLAVPKLTYGLEICDINQNLRNKLDVTGRTILKSFFDMSKFSRNYLHSFFNVDLISVILTRNKLNLFVRLMNNPSTSNIILCKLEHSIKRDTFVSNINELCRKHDIDFYDLLVQNKKVFISCIHDKLPEYVIEAIEFWHVKEQREILRLILKKKSLLTIDMSSNSYILYLFIFVCLPCIFFARWLREYIYYYYIYSILI